MATTIQDAICEWLLSVNEKKTEKWFRKTWCGERGNYTNSSAGYVGNKVANSLKAKWKYYRRDTTETTGTNLRMSFNVFIPSHIRYVRDLSRKHFSDMVGEDGLVRFPTYPTITTELWKEVQSMDSRILHLWYVEGAQSYTLNSQMQSTREINRKCIHVNHSKTQRMALRWQQDAFSTLCMQRNYHAVDTCNHNAWEEGFRYSGAVK